MTKSITSLFLALSFGFCVSCTKKEKTSENPSIKCQLEWGNGEVSLEQGCQFTSSQDGNPSQILFPVSSWDPKVKNLSIKMRVRGLVSLEGVRFVFSNGKQDIYSYEVPMFADPEFNILQEDTFVDFSIPQSSLKSESGSKNLIDTVKVYLKAKDKSRVKLSLANYSLSEKKSPQGLISITFDDGYRSNLQAAQIMKEYNLHGTAYLIPEAFDKPGYLTQEEVKSIQEMGWDISSHFTNPVTSFYSDELLKEMNTVKNQIQSLSGTLKGAEHFAYPLGKHKQKVIDVLKNVFKSARLASGGFETLPPREIYRIRSINVLPTMTAEQLTELAKKANDNGDWAVFMFHSLDEEERGDLNYSSSQFKRFIESLSKNNIQVKTMSEALAL